MFKIIEDPQFTEDVAIDVPDGEGWQQQILRTRFRALPLSDLRAIDDAEGESLTVLLDRIVVSFENLVDGKGDPLPGDGEWRQRMLDFQFVRAGLFRAYYKAQSGVRSGNSAPSVAPGHGAS